jgi:hypothetical protein
MHPQWIRCHLKSSIKKEKKGKRWTRGDKKKKKTPLQAYLIA